jgi:hypothetical protein
MTSRRLTENELALAKSVFGNSINYKRVRIHDHPHPVYRKLGLQPDHIGITNISNIYMPADCYEKDYALSRQRAFFIHELTHVWQSQNHPLRALKDLTEAVVGTALKHKFNYGAIYAFHLDPKKDLMDYGLEQQASMVEEYFVVKHEGRSNYVRRCQNAASAAEKLSLYEDVLKKFNKNPSYTRLRHKIPGLSKIKKPKF